MLIENIKEAFQNLLSNKMRSLLTMLGIIIGISAVITITTIGTSIKSTLNATLNSLGGNSISASVDAIYPEDDADWSNWEYPKMTADDYITQDMLDEHIRTKSQVLVFQLILAAVRFTKTVINMRMWTQQERQKKNWST